VSCDAAPSVDPRRRHVERVVESGRQVAFQRIGGLDQRDPVGHLTRIHAGACGEPRSILTFTPGPSPTCARAAGRARRCHFPDASDTLLLEKTPK
jgi:hypothetical protein